MHIREAREDDCAAVFAVHKAAFPTDAEARLVDLLLAGGDLVFSLLAEADADIVGHIALSRMTAPFRALGLAPVGVLPDWQRAGIGSMLIRDGLRRAREAGWDAVFVLGDPGYYGRFGFRVDLASGFSCRFAGPHFMALAMGPTLPTTLGTIAYAAAFDALD